MIIKYNASFSKEAINNNVKRIINQIYKLLPMRQEHKDWEKPLETIIQELVGIKRFFPECEEELFMLLCKLQGMFELTQDSDFSLYRRTIFECLGLLGDLKNYVNSRS